MKHGIGRLVWLAGAGALMLSRTAQADITGYWVDSDNWLVKVSNLIDLDQIRGMKAGVPGLPNNGKMYCAPTASMNALAYLAAHGYPKIGPGNKNWQLAAQYNTMTNNLATLGTAMGTDAFKGTGGTGQVNGIKAWIAFDPTHAGDFTVNYIGATAANPNPVADAAKTLLQGAVGCSVNGWYKWSDYNNAWIRNGGHVHGLAGASSEALFAPANITICDPAKDTSNDIYTQSTFATETYNLHTVPELCGWLDNNNTFHSAGHLQKMENYGGLLDGIVVIRALQGLTADANQFILYTPVRLLNKDQATATKMMSGDEKPITSLAMDPTDTRHPYLTAGGDLLWELETLTGKSHIAARGLRNARQVVIGGTDRNRFVLSDSMIQKFAPNGELIGLLELAFPIDQIAFDQKNNRLVGVSMRRLGTAAPMHDISVFDGDTLGLLDAFDIGEKGLPAGGFNVSIDPATGKCFFHHDGDKYVMLLPAVRTESVKIIPLKGALRPVGLHVTEQGDFVLCDGSVMKVFMADGSVRGASKLRGLPAGRLIDTLRSFDNSDPLMKNNPAFDNVLPNFNR